MRCGDQRVDLTPKERDIPKRLLANQHKILSCERIRNTIWPVNEEPLTDIVGVEVVRLHRRLGACGDCTAAVRRVGYRFNACVDAATVPASSGD